MASYLRTVLKFVGWDPYVENETKEVDWEREEKVSDINKRTLGRFIIKVCGNEGAENTPSEKYLRRLLQGSIDSIEKHPEVDWANAVLEIYGDDGTPYKISSGTAKHKFYALIDDKGEINIVKKR